jgi:hypothetical protein
MRLDRRQFLGDAALLSLGLAAGLGPARAVTLSPTAPAMPVVREPAVRQVASPARGLVLGPGTSLRPDGSPFFFLAALDADQVTGAEYVLHQIPLDFFGHGVVPDPRHPERVAVFQKKGKGACEVDLRTGRVLRPIVTPGARKFYGHGAYSPDGQLLYATESDEADGYRGLISVRDAATFRELGEFPTYGAAPHDCRLIDGGRILVVTNGGGPLGGAVPTVTYVEVQSRKLLEKLELSRDTINAGHLAVGVRGDLAVVSAQRDGLPPATSTGGVSLRTRGARLRTLEAPTDVVGRMFGETLSVRIDDRNGVVAATTPIANLLTFWELATGKLLRACEAVNPRGVALTLDGRYFAVSYGMPPALSLIDTRTLETVAGGDRLYTGMSGSHLISYSLADGRTA